VPATGAWPRCRGGRRGERAVADLVSDVADRLYGLPLEDFVSGRDAAARTLRKEKERDAAQEVAALTKPSAGAWAVNAIAREQPDLRDELLAAGDAVREAQEAAVAGEGARALREATARQRAAIDAVLDAAARLKPGGKALSRPALDRLRQTLQAAAGDDEIRAAIAAGRLVRDAEAGGAWPFGGGGDAEVAPAPRRKPPPAAKRSAPAREDDRAARAEREAREVERREAEERRKEIEARLGEARAERRARERELARAERDAERADKRLEEAQAVLDEAQQHADEARTELDAAREAVDHARDDAARLEEQLD
jgi:hypothetical protein